MQATTKRTILRVFHLVVSIPIMGYVYGPPAEVAQYADATRWIFIPVIILSGFWMYAGFAFAAVGVALWLGTYKFGGINAALLGQFVFFAAWIVWRMARRRKAAVN